MRRNGQNSTSDQIYNFKFEIPMGCFLFEYEFWWYFREDYEWKTAFVMQNFQNLAAGGVEVTIFWRNPQKAHPWLSRMLLAL